MAENTPDWEIGTLYSQAWNIVKKNKILWILGIAAGGGVSFNSFSNINSSTIQNLFNKPGNENLQQKTSQVLGAATSSPFNESIKAIFSHIPFSIYLTLSLELLILVLIGLVITVIYSAWIHGLLIASTDQAAAGEKVDLGQASHKVIPRIPSIVWLQIIPGLVFFVSIVVVSLVLIFLFASKILVLQIIAGILTVIAIGALIFWGIMLNFSQIWAIRQAVLEGKYGKAALFSGFRVAKKKFWSMALLGFVNNILVGFASLGAFIAAIIAIVILIIIGFVFVKLVPPLLAPMIIIGVILLIPVGIGLSLIGGFANSFKATVWTLAYRQIKGKYD
jgi:hypothetical protein